MRRQNRGRLRKFATCEIFFFFKNKIIKKSNFFILFFIYMIFENRNFIYNNNKNNNNNNNNNNNIFITKRQRGEQWGRKHYCSANFRILRKFTTTCENFGFAKFRNLRNFSGCQISILRLRNFCAPSCASHCIKILIKTAKINTEKLRKFAEK